MSEPTTPEERAQHAVRLKMADDKWAELVANEHYENAGSGHHWYWSQGFIWGMRAAEPEINMMREAICRLADQDATLSVCDGDVTVSLDATLTDEERDDLRVWLAECLRQASTATEGGNEELAERWLGRARRAASLLERLGGER